MEKSKNGLGVAGFVLALVAITFCYFGSIAIILGAIGFILSLIGLIIGIKKEKKLGLSIAGLSISIVAIGIGIWRMASMYSGLRGFPPDMYF